jgi:hypothetical protein
LPTITPRKFAGQILPIGLLYTGSLLFNNLPYLTLNVAFIQMLKVCRPSSEAFGECLD